MRMTCETQPLKRALRLLKAPSDKERMILMHADQGQLRLEIHYGQGWLWYGQDWLYMQTTIPAEVEEPGSASVVLDRFESILERTPEETLHFSYHEWHNRLDIEGKQHQHSLNGSREAQAQPAEWLLGDASWYTFDAHEFGRGLKHVLFAATSSDENRSFLRGALLHRHQGQHRWIATDGRRLAMFTFPAPAEATDGEATFPTRAIPYLACVKLIDVVESLDTSTCRLRFREQSPVETGWKFMFFECGEVSLHCRLAEGDFPDWGKILPNPTPPLRVELSREVLLWALKLVHASEGEHGRTEFRVQPGQMTLETAHPAIGRSLARVAAQYDGPETLVVFNAHLIQEGLEHTMEPTVTFCLRPMEKQQESAVLELASDLYYLVMPMR